MCTARAGSLPILAMLLASGCSRQDSETYFPLHDGARREYVMESSAQGVVTQSRVVERLDGTETINSRQYARVVSITSGGAGVMLEPMISYYRVAPDGIHGVFSREHPEEEELVLPASPKVGSRWGTPTSYSDVRCTVEAIEDAQLFHRKYANTLRTRCEGTVQELTISLVSHYAPGVGVVRRSGTYRRGGEVIQVWKMELAPGS